MGMRTTAIPGDLTKAGHWPIRAGEISSQNRQKKVFQPECACQFWDADADYMPGSFSLAWFRIRILTRYLMRDLSVLVEEVNEVQNGNFDVEIQSSATEEIHVLAQSITGCWGRLNS